MSNRPVRYILCFLLLAISSASAQITPPESIPPAPISAEPGRSSTLNDTPMQANSIAMQHEGTQPQNVFINVRSDTVYMNSGTMRSWLQRQPEFAQLKLAFTTAQGSADYYLEITRPLFTWDWTYSIVKTGTGKVVGSGKVTEATAERAARAIAPRIIRVLYGEAATSDTTATANGKGTIPGGVLPKRFVAHEELAGKLESAKTIAVHSSTVWFDENNLEKALGERPEFSGWGYRFATPRREDEPVLADLIIVINRPLFTWDWTFSILDPIAKKSLASGKVTAVNDAAAAPMLAKSIVGTIANVRGLPSSMRRRIDQTLTETNVRTWNVRHVSGQRHLEGGQKIQLAVGLNTVFARDGDDILFSVPVEDLLQFSYTSSLRDRSVKWFEGWEKAGEILFSGVGSDPQAAAGALMVALPMLAIEHGVGGLLKGSMATDHFVILHWKDMSGVSSATLQGNEIEVRAICTELQRFSKRSATDLDAAAQSTRTALEQAQQSTKYYVETDRNVSLENTVLAPGQYRVIILPREVNLAEVYFLNAVNSTILARTLVEYERGESDRGARVTYATLSGIQTFREIRIEQHILRFSPVPIFVQEL